MRILNEWRNNGGTSMENGVSQRHSKLLACSIRRITSLIYSLCLPALLDEPGAVYSNTYKHLKKTQPATAHQSHGAFDLHLQIYVIMLLSFAFYSSLLSSPSSLSVFSITPPRHPGAVSGLPDIPICPRPLGTLTPQQQGLTLR